MPRKFLQNPLNISIQSTVNEVLLIFLEMSEQVSTGIAIDIFLLVRWFCWICCYTSSQEGILARWNLQPHGDFQWPQLAFGVLTDGPWFCPTAAVLSVWLRSLPRLRSDGGMKMKLPPPSHPPLESDHALRLSLPFWSFCWRERTADHCAVSCPSDAFSTDSSKGQRRVSREVRDKELAHCYL